MSEPTGLPQLADFGLVYPGLDEGRGHVSAIQPHHFRAPEVLLGCSWPCSVDIWNLGLLNLLEDVNLFEKPAGEDGEYDAYVDLLGEPPEELVIRERYFRAHRLKEPVKDMHGKEYVTINEFWGGPFFADDNKIFRRDLLGRGKALANTITELSGEEKDLFLDFASDMLG
ncbi:hypothetical protein M406DRAFT_348693 [Cryphonectria parasitica EP155]|uniref:Protein kinase domain-containing protein n=1 Tax=Cryphonectria parasitica (strain ATCC 38755 / EP155) TaxID=660469 RepID=A0A9P4XSP9_CRYP1|nr:uncharacterized protein M406DRAFT_348693 [Cryphonectria parasitica EP155]KAF3760060.1 hypothetical protein M406DRAFT_348693 [Cryphonectria parasitica EP155]